eukprot:886178-Rhodomonas_salina.1
MTRSVRKDSDRPGGTLVPGIGPGTRPGPGYTGTRPRVTSDTYATTTTSTTRVLLELLAQYLRLETRTGCAAEDSINLKRTHTGSIKELQVTKSRTVTDGPSASV